MPTPILFAAYFVTWWLVLLIVLPFGAKSVDEMGGETPIGVDPGAPVAPMLGRKLIWTTLISAVLFAVFYVGLMRFG